MRHRPVDVMDEFMCAPRPYRRRDPSSPVRVYQSGDGFIWIGFEQRGRRTAYRYTDASAGAAAVARMQALAARGHGLATYVARQLAHRAGYDRRIAF